MPPNTTKKGTQFDKPEWNWLTSRLDPHNTKRIWVEDLLSFAEVATASVTNTNLLYYDDQEEQQIKTQKIQNEQRKRNRNRNRTTTTMLVDLETGRPMEQPTEQPTTEEQRLTQIDHQGTNAEFDFLPDVKRRRRKHTKRELEQIHLLEKELDELMSTNDKTEEELEWWRSQHEWQDATIHSVSARRTKLRKSMRALK